MPEVRSDQRIIKRDGELWRIREASATTVPGAHGARCLICESDYVVRRIWSYPSNWRSLSDDELLNICDRSVP